MLADADDSPFTMQALAGRAQGGGRVAESRAGEAKKARVWQQIAPNRTKSHLKIFAGTVIGVILFLCITITNKFRVSGASCQFRPPPPPKGAPVTPENPREKARKKSCKKPRDGRMIAAGFCEI